MFENVVWRLVEGYVAKYIKVNAIASATLHNNNRHNNNHRNFAMMNSRFPFGKVLLLLCPAIPIATLSNIYIVVIALLPPSLPRGR
jgi:hypothetical protein